MPKRDREDTQNLTDAELQELKKAKLDQEKSPDTQSTKDKGLAYNVKPCIKCGSSTLPGSRFCRDHQPGQDSGGETPNSAGAGKTKKDEEQPKDLQFQLEGTEASFELLDDVFDQNPDVGQYFASTNINHYKFKNMEHLSPLQKQELINNLNLLMKETYKELGKKYDLDVKVETDKSGKTIYQFVNFDGSELSAEQKQKINANFSNDLQDTFNSLSSSFTQNNGLNYRIIMVPGSPTPSHKHKDDEKGQKDQMENKLPGYKSPSPFRDMYSLEPKKPIQ